MTEKSSVTKSGLKKRDVAVPLHIQRLEAALDIRPFVSYVEKFLNSDGGSETDDDSDSQTKENEMSKGDKAVHGVVTTKQGLVFIINFGQIHH